MDTSLRIVMSVRGTNQLLYLKLSKRLLSECSSWGAVGEQGSS